MTTKSKTKDDIRKPTKEQKRDIISLLQDVYDVENQRYKNCESDQSVATACEIPLWGWVTQLREEFFGPSGNEADLIAAKELREFIEQANSLVAKSEAMQKRFMQRCADEIKEIIKTKEKAEAVLKTFNPHGVI